MTNAGSKVNEFYIYAEGDRIVGEVENISPGLTRTFHVDLSDPGTYQTACKPGMVGDGIRADFTVTGSAAAAPHEHRSRPRRRGRRVPGVRRRPVRRASSSAPRSSWPWSRPARSTRPRRSTRSPARTGSGSSRSPSRSATSTRRSTAAPRSSTTGCRSPATTASRRTCGSTACRPTPPADRRPAARRRHRARREGEGGQLNPLQLANGSKALLDEMATGKITGEEERYSHTDLWDFDANFEGSQAAIEALRPFLKAEEPDPARDHRPARRRARRADRLAQDRATASCSTPR